MSLPSGRASHRPIRQVMPDHRDLDDALTVDALDASNRMLFSAMPFNLVAVVFVVFVLGTSVSWGRRLTWAALMLVVVLFGLAVALAYQRRRRSGPVLQWRWGVVASACAGVGWASLVLIAFPPASNGASRAFVLVLMLGVSSVSLLSTAASRGRFAAFNVPDDRHAHRRLPREQRPPDPNARHGDSAVRGRHGGDAHADPRHRDHQHAPQARAARRGDDRSAHRACSTGARSRRRSTSRSHWRAGRAS